MQFRFKSVRLALAATGLLALGSSPSFAAEESVAELRALIQQLDQKIKVLERKQELDKESATEKAKTTAVVTAGAGGFQIRSADTNFVLKVRGYVQADARFYPDDNSSGSKNDTFLLRRVRPIFEGTLYDKYDFRVMLDFPSGNTISANNNGLVQDAYLNARFFPGFQVQVGKFKEPVGLERLQSGANLLFIERSYPTQLLPNRDVGIQIQGDLLNNTLNYQVGAFNGVADGGSGDTDATNFDDEKDIAARLFTTPFRNSDNDALRGLGFGVSGTFGDREGAPRGYSSAGQQSFFAYTGTVVADGQHWRVSPQAYYYWGPFGLVAEYAVSSLNLRNTANGREQELTHTGWQVAASWFLTGEENSFKAVQPLKPFTVGGDGWGAWEVAARVSQLDIDDDAFTGAGPFASSATAASAATSYGLGVNWHLNRNVKFSLNYELTDFDGGTSPLLENGEQALFARAQVAF